MPNPSTNKCTAFQNIGALSSTRRLLNKNTGNQKLPYALLTICFITFLASFDFTIFIFLSDTINLTFFAKSGDLYSEQLKLVSLFAIGFIARPIGALLIGRYGDNKGRKPALHVGLILLFSTSLVAACLPTYANIGVTASVLIILVRLFQGAAFANQLSLSWVYLAESYSYKEIAAYISMVCASFVLGAVICALFIACLTLLFTAEQLTAYAWRIPFICSGVMGVLGYLLVCHLSETDAFLKQTTAIIPPKKMTLSTVTDSLNRFNAILLTCFLALIYASSIIMFLLLLPKLINSQVNVDDSSLRFLTVVGMSCMALGMIFFGKLADKLDVGRALMLGAALMCFQTLMFYYYLSNGDGTYLVPIYALMGFCSGFISLCPMIFLQLFPTHIRLTAISVIFHSMTVFTGVILPISLLFITETVSFAPALYLVFISICAFFIGIYVYQAPQVPEYQTAIA